MATPCGNVLGFAHMAAPARVQVPADYIETTSGVAGGKPCIRGTRTKVSLIARRHEHLGESPDEIVDALPHLTLAGVHAALAYYYDHREEIEAELHAADEFVLEMARKSDPTW